mgnify:CR=1 FL=1
MLTPQYSSVMEFLITLILDFVALNRDHFHKIIELNFVDQKSWIQRSDTLDKLYSFFSKLTTKNLKRYGE